MGAGKYNYATRAIFGSSLSRKFEASKEKDIQSASKGSSSKANYYIIAGHHNSDSGAIGLGGVKEANLTIELRELVAGSLRAYTPNVFTDDNFLSLGAVISWINKHANPQDIIVDLHFNASDNQSANGSEAFVSDVANQSEKHAASVLLDDICGELYTVNRGVKSESESNRGRLGILHAVGLNVLLEVCFITNKNDLASYMARKACLAHRLARSLSELARK